ncbi:MAG TPA: DUF2938 family protein [Ramlibacter sp.]|jgi:hypothetical protein
MEFTLQTFAKVAWIGVGATLVLDLWALLLRRLGVPTLDITLIGRWIGHWRRGVFAHAAIGQAPAVPGERALGWLFHYATGIAFAALLVALHGHAWLAAPSPLLAICFGVATVAAPWLLMQPAMGAGLASSRTRTPGRNRVRSLANHFVFGFGLYLAAVVVARISR